LVTEGISRLGRVLRQLRRDGKSRDKKMKKLTEAAELHARRLKRAERSTSRIKTDIAATLASWKTEMTQSAEAAKASLMKELQTVVSALRSVTNELRTARASTPHAASGRCVTRIVSHCCSCFTVQKGAFAVSVNTRKPD
jgi:chromosome segregation ATPase